MTISVIGLLALMPLAGNAQEQGRPETGSTGAVTIGTVSGQLDTADEFTPFTDYLGSQIPGRDYEMVPFSSIDALMDAVDGQELDFAFITPAAFVELNLRHELRTLATITQMAGGSPSPWLTGAVFTPEDRDDISSLEDAGGKRVIALSQLALGGWLSAVREWRDLSIDANRDFASLDFVFSYTEVINQVCSGNADIGVLPASTFQSYAGSCAGGLKVLPQPDGRVDRRYPLPHSTRLYPEVAFVMTREQDEDFIRQLTLSLLAIEPGSEAARSAYIAGFTTPLTYTEVQDLMQDLRLGPYAGFGQLTITRALQENAFTVIIVLSGIILLITLGFIRANTLSRKFQQSEAYRKRVFEGSHVATVVIDPETSEFLDLNPAAIRLYGYRSRDEVAHLTPADVSAVRQDAGIPILEAVRLNNHKALQEGEAVFEWRHQRPNGELWDAKVHLMSFESTRGKLIQGTLEDITEQKHLDEERRHLENQLVLSQRMESIGRLAGGIAHDFNNLLTVINGYCDMLLADADKDSPLHSNLEQVRTAGLRASELTSQLLTFSRRRITQPVAVNIDAIIQESEDMFKSVLGEEIKLVISLMQSPGLFMSDPGQLHQVLLNLVVNAKDAMPDGGILRITTQNRHLSNQTATALDLKPGDYVVLSLSDTGNGMDEDVRDHIFEPFFSTKGESGTGLGLSTVYGIVRQAQGAVIVDSEPGKGTTFTLYFPRTEKAAHEEKAVEEDEWKAPGPMTILVVEDQEEVKEYVTSVLEKAGYTVFSCYSGAEALSCADERQGNIQLLLTDVVLEGMNGRELAEIFAEKYPETKILFTSGYADDEIARRGVQQGEMDFLEKPYLPNILLAKVAEVLRD